MEPEFELMRFAGEARKLPVANRPVYGYMGNAARYGSLIILNSYRAGFRHMVDFCTKMHVQAMVLDERYKTIRQL
ncbi:hypothetical protein [Endozoicomonas sp. SCSIO W0465]|uniref:hypothetical protein n=1 Tax=Endozoicomonas sp. SCSIO W0465 TaxID=2918516 RepID=UPI0020758E1B|nr:hypothetical protein [Endozoicomonas sp. SCSIO W0465]USE34561.1 hypothetical protein MJO57_20790 [Endozoicomonas sp. SCSIO W0465]